MGRCAGPHPSSLPLPVTCTLSWVKVELHVLTPEPAPLPDFSSSMNDTQHLPGHLTVVHQAPHLTPHPVPFILHLSHPPDLHKWHLGRFPPALKPSSLDVYRSYQNIYWTILKLYHSFFKRVSRREPRKLPLSNEATEKHQRSPEILLATPLLGVQHTLDFLK